MLTNEQIQDLLTAPETSVDWKKIADDLVVDFNRLFYDMRVVKERSQLLRRLLSAVFEHTDTSTASMLQQEMFSLLETMEDTLV